MSRPPATVRLKSGNSLSKRALIHRYVLAHCHLPEFQYVTTKDICEEIGLDYETNKNYVRKERCVAQNRYTVTVMEHDSHRNKFVWQLPEWRHYKDTMEEAEFHYGWNFSKHNKLWFYHDSTLGSILWHNTDRVELFLRGSPQLAKAKQLFNNGFFRNHLVDDFKEVDRVFNIGRIETKHHTFEIGEKLPRFQIDYFAGSHGLTLYTDGSHPESLEVSETKPFWLDELYEIKDGFKTDMAEHMTLLTDMRKLQKQLEKKATHKTLLDRVRRFFVGS